MSYHVLTRASLIFLNFLSQVKKENNFPACLPFLLLYCRSTVIKICARCDGTTKEGQPNLTWQEILRKEKRGHRKGFQEQLMTEFSLKRMSSNSKGRESEREFRLRACDY